MQVGSVTTPFGRRPMTFGMLASQRKAEDLAPDQSVDKWKISRALCEAKPLLGLSDRALAVLNALLSFYPGNELSAENGLIVFPSNAQLSIRAHGIAAATLRRHLAALVEAGLLVRKDSPNGKRFARRDGEGEIDQAYGFNIAPLIARAGEIQLLAAQVMADRQLLRAARERLSLCRRDIAKLIEAALAEGVSGDWAMVHGHFRRLVMRIPRSATIEQLDPIVDEMEMLRREILNLLEVRLNSGILYASESHSERHIQESNPDSIFDSERVPENRQGESPAPGEWLSGMAVGDIEIAVARGAEDVSIVSAMPVMRSEEREAGTPGLKSFPLGLVLKACPEIVAYGPGGAVDSWRDLMAATTVVRCMLDVSASAYEEACCIMGPRNAATVMACVLERAGSIHSPGGYLRDLTRRAERGEFAIGPMLMSLARANGGAATGAG